MVASFQACWWRQWKGGNSTAATTDPNSSPFVDLPMVGERGPKLKGSSRITTRSLASLTGLFE